MGKRMLISVDADESRVAIVDRGRLANLEIETLANEEYKGNLYKGIVHKVEPSLQAAFVDFGVEKQGFLPFSEVHPRLYPEGVGKDKKATIQEVLKPKQEVLVQVIRDEIGNKGATLTTYISIPGRSLVLMPESSKTGISRKIPDDERKRLKEILSGLELPEGFGVIVRTAGIECSEEELGRDLEYLTRMWDTIDGRFKTQKEAGLLFEERSLAIRAVRDYFTDEIEEVWLDNLKAYKEVMDFVAVLMPAHKEAVRLYRDAVPLFIRNGIEDQIEEVFSRRVPLQSGGSIVIDSTEALVAIDVNSGKVKGEDIEETAFITNMEAAEEIARQVIIRDLGGLVCIDFIDMTDRKRMRQVETALKEAFKHDKARRKFSRISEFGLLEMSRQRLKSTLLKSSFDRCPHCDGQGQVRSPDSSGMYLLRRIREVAANGRISQVVVRAPIPVANFVVNRKRRELYALEVQHSTTVEVYGDEDIKPTQATIQFFERRGKGQPRQTIQKVDLIRSEVVRGEDEYSKLPAVILREPRKLMDYDELYKEIEDKHGKPQERPREKREEAPVVPAPVQERVAAPVVEAPAPPRRKISWWQRLLGVSVVEDEPMVEPTPAPAPAPVRPSAPSRPAHTPRPQEPQQTAARPTPSAPSPRPSRPSEGPPRPQAGPRRAVSERSESTSESTKAERSGATRKRRRRSRRSSGRGEAEAGAGAEGAVTATGEAREARSDRPEAEGGDDGGASSSQKRSRSRRSGRSKVSRVGEAGASASAGGDGGAAPRSDASAASAAQPDRAPAPQPEPAEARIARPERPAGGDGESPAPRETKPMPRPTVPTAPVAAPAQAPPPPPAARPTVAWPASKPDAPAAPAPKPAAPAAPTPGASGGGYVIDLRPKREPGGDGPGRSGGPTGSSDES
jgi:ribonuclease E